MMNLYFSTHETAEMLKVSDDFVRNLIKAKCLKAAKVGKGYVIKKDWLDELLDLIQGEQTNSLEEIQAIIETKKLH